jgi:VRR-NUC domain-containing protein
MPSLTREEAKALGRRAQRSPRTPKEREIQKAILSFLSTVPGVVVWKTGGGMFRMEHKGKMRMVRMGHRGVSDIVGWHSRAWPYQPIARFLAIEVKRPNRYPTMEQTVFLERVRAAGGIAIVARSVADVVAALGLGAAHAPEART